MFFYYVYFIQSCRIETEFFSAENLLKVQKTLVNEKVIVEVNLNIINIKIIYG